jgi:type IV secretory pathway VirB4 component
MNRAYDSMYDNRLIIEELDHEPLMLSMHAASLVSQLNTEQRHVFDTITSRVLSGSPGFFFVCGHGGTGKTFLWNAIITSLRSEKNSACSGIIWCGFSAATKRTYCTLKIQNTFRPK